jgi:hypothetical protein
MGNTSSHAVDLRKEAEISMGHLIRLEEHLIPLRKEAELESLGEAIAAIPALLMGEKLEPGKTDLILDFLTNVENWKKNALEHVAATLQTLHALDGDMEELRTRVAEPDIVGDKIPIEVHVKSIKAGTDRLKEGQMRAILRETGISA